MLSSSKMVSMYSSYCSAVFLGGTDFCRDYYVYLRNVTVFWVYLLYLVLTHQIGRDMELYCLCECQDVKHHFSELTHG